MTIGHTSSFFNHSINSTRGSFPVSLASFFGLPSACLRLFQPPLEFLCGDDALVAFLFLLSGLFTPGVELAVADAPGLDPRKAAFVLPAINLEHRIVRLLQRPLLECAHRTAAGLTVEWCAVAVLRADAACLGEVPPAVFAAAHGDAALHASLQRKSDHIRYGIRVQHRRASIAIHRLKARGQQTEREQLRVAGLVRLVKMIIPHDLPAGLAPGFVYIQYQLEEPLDLLLVQRRLRMLRAASMAAWRITVLQKASCVCRICS